MHVSDYQIALTQEDHLVHMREEERENLDEDCLHTLFIELFESFTDAFAARSRRAEELFHSKSFDELIACGDD